MVFDQIFENPTFGGIDSNANRREAAKQARHRQSHNSSIQFVNVESPCNGGLAKNNKLVRSHVMRHNRRRGRQGQAAQARQNATSAVQSSGREAGDAQRLMKIIPTVFGDCSASLPGDVELHLESFERFIAHCQLPFHMSDGQAQLRTRDLITAAFSNEMLLHAVLAVSMTSQRPQPGDAQELQRIAKHRGRASKLLLDSFATSHQGMSDESMVAVYLMATQDIMIGGSPDTYEMHMQGLYRMVALRGGLDKLGMDGLLKTIILWADQYKAIYLGVRPHYSVPPRVEHMSLALVSNFSYHGTRKLWRQGLVEKDLVHTTEGLTELIGLLERKATGEDVEMPLSALLRQRYLLEERLRPSAYPLRRSPRTLEPVVSAVARMYVATILSRMPFGLRDEEEAKLPRLAQEVKDSILNNSMDMEWAQCVGFLLWVFFSGSLQNPGSHFRQWLLVECQPVIVRLRFAQVPLQRIKFLVQGYVWSDKYLDHQVEAFWDEAHNFTRSGGW